jgi:thiamine-phosphate pyrophosphorylase
MIAPRLVIVTDLERADRDAWLARLDPWLARAEPASVLVQLRDRQLEARERLAFGGRLRALTRRHAQLFAVNDRLDLALMLEADAVHLPEAGVPVAVARRLLERYRRDWFISVACHEPQKVPEAFADAVLLSPVCAARKGRPALGIAGVQSAALSRERSASARGCRIYALGGVEAIDAASLLGAGADGVAVIGALFDPRGPEPLLDALGILR